MHTIKFIFFEFVKILFFGRNLTDFPLRIWKAHNQTRNGAKTEAKTTLEILYKKVRPIFSDSSFVFGYTKGHQKTLRACARALPSSCHQSSKITKIPKKSTFSFPAFRKNIGFRLVNLAGAFKYRGCIFF